MANPKSGVRGIATRVSSKRWRVPRRHGDEPAESGAKPPRGIGDGTRGEAPVVVSSVGALMRALAAGSWVFPVTQDEHEDDAQDEQVEPDIPGAGSAVRAHGGAVVLTVTR